MYSSAKQIWGCDVHPGATYKSVNMVLAKTTLQSGPHFGDLLIKRVIKKCYYIA